MLELEPEQLGPFPESLRLTEEGDVTLVPVPGHTPGQMGMLRGKVGGVGRMSRGTGDQVPR